MEKIEINTSFGDKPTRVEVVAPMGGGGAVYPVIIDKYYNGQIVNTANYGWQIYLHPETILQGDDVSVIIELLEATY